jgi:hypothetical protein
MISLTNILRGAPYLEEWFEPFEARRSSMIQRVCERGLSQDPRVDYFYFH